ncbi:LLM class flavin-dependent oxidoreductase [Granulicoccus phenolivorans]|uniref:LLM class flavin-dependent oxidoreductase n=1 Tax=Granulicoccus phenolivorans TaxID=266854 RepID=UPI000478B5D6|nr:LLM class flavin-dependent oxidoreductase [Granulicoccus phenolivorans]
MRLSVLDLAPVDPGTSFESALSDIVTLAQHAETRGYERVWYAEHHNMAEIASSATSVLIAHVAANTATIRLGSGGVMLPNHSPLVIAEQFGTLAALHPNRIDLGLGRAPGTDQRTVRALRRAPEAAEQFPSDVVELQRLLAGESPMMGVKASPVAQTPPPLYILGSSLFGASLAAHLGLPYAFASHFAPDMLTQALMEYRRNFRPSAQLAQPYAIVGANVIAAADPAEAAAMEHSVLRNRVRRFISRGPGARPFTEEELDLVMDTPQGQQIAGMMRVRAVGDGAAVRAGLESIQQATDADEIMIAFHGRTPAERLTGLELTADALLG